MIKKLIFAVPFATRLSWWELKKAKAEGLARVQEKAAEIALLERAKEDLVATIKVFEKEVSIGFSSYHPRAAGIALHRMHQVTYPRTFIQTCAMPCVCVVLYLFFCVVVVQLCVCMLSLGSVC